jgi:hypothetical protein
MIGYTSCQLVDNNFDTSTVLCRVSNLIVMNRAQARPLVCVNTKLLSCLLCAVCVNIGLEGGAMPPSGPGGTGGAGKEVGESRS